MTRTKVMTLDKLKAREGQEIKETIANLLEEKKYLKTDLIRTKLQLEDEKNKLRFVESEYKKVVDERNDHIEKIIQQDQKIKKLSQKKIPTCDKSIIEMIERNKRETKELEQTIVRDFNHTFDKAFRKKYTIPK